MFTMLFLGLLIVVGLSVGVVGALSVYAPRLLSVVLEPRRWARHRRGGPRPTGRPIEEVAADLRGVLAQRDRILASRSSWYVVHDLRVCERRLHDVAEEAAVALGLPPCPAPLGGWTSVHLGVRLRQLADAGFSLPDHAALGGE